MFYKVIQEVARVRKKTISIVSLVVFLFCTSSTILAVNNPQETISKSKIKFQQMNEKIMETNKQVSAMNTKIKKLNTEINKTNSEIANNNKLLEKEKTHMEQLIKEVDSNQDIANKRLKAMYVNGYSESTFEVLLTAENFSDFFRKYEAVKSVVSFDKKLFNDLKAKKDMLSESISNIDLKNKQLKQLKAHNEESLKEINSNKEKLQGLIKEFDKEKTLAAEAIKENEEKLIAHSISVIDSGNSTITDMKNALQSLNGLYPQISTDSVKKKAKTYIESGNKKLAYMIANNTKPIVSDNNTYKATFIMEATAYSGGGLSAIGLKLVRDEANLSTIAVDPKVIPLGTKVYIPGYGYAVCADTGGAIKGNIIDLYLNSEEECERWGRRKVTLYIVAYPGEW